MNRLLARRSGPLLLGLALLGGCAARQAEEAPLRARDDVKAEAPARPDPGEPAAQSPHEQVPGGPAGPADEGPAVRFREPAGEPRPVATERRPGLPGEVELAVAAVRDGRVLGAEELILRVDAELSYEEEIAIVTGAGGRPDTPEVDLAGLARLAGGAGHHLLLVDVRPSRRERGLRDGYLLHAATGALLAAWTVAPGAPPPRPTGDPADDLVERIVAAHHRLGAE